jgi:hypothetical protein
MNTQQKLRAALAGTEAGKNNALIEELAHYVDLLHGFGDPTLQPAKDEKVEAVRDTVKKLGQALRELPDWKLGSWAPHPDQAPAARQLSCDIMALGLDFEGEAKETKPKQKQIEIVAFGLADIWKRHIGKPGTGGNSPFPKLFRKGVLPDGLFDANSETIDNKTIKKALSNAS